MRAIHLPAFLTFLAFLGLAAPAMAYDAPRYPEVNSSLLSHAPLSTDYTQGNTSAPVTFIEYASLSCPHCAHFQQEIYPDLKKRYIDTGKMLYILRQYPLNEPALKAAMLVDCVGEKSGAARYYTFVHVLFEEQAKWAYDQSFLSELQTFAEVGGVSKEDFHQCVNDPSRELAILKDKQRATKDLGITGTPYLFINGRHYDGEISPQRMNAYIDGLLSGPTKTHAAEVAPAADK